MSAHAADAHEHHPPAQHTFHPYKTGMHPGILGLVIFLVSEAGLFGSFFMYYGHQRLLRDYPWPPEGFEIPADATSINTAILVASSFTCELALWSLWKSNRRGLIGWLAATLVLGLAFLGLQVHEYMTIGFTPQDEPVGAAFFSLTGLHGVHVFVGALLLTFCLVRAIRGHFSPGNHPALAGTAIYWHFVDIVWIILYTLVYLLPTKVI